MTEDEFRTGRGSVHDQAKTQCVERERAYVGDRPFHRHDTRNQAKVGPNMTLVSLIDRIHNMAERHGNAAHGIAGQLEVHAEMVHGPLPPSNGEAAGLSTAEPYYGEGQLAQLFIAVDMLDRRLDDALSRVAYAAGRNTTLA